MSGSDGDHSDGIWRIGPVRLLAAVGVGYLAVVLTLTLLKVDVVGRSHEPDPGRVPGAAPVFPDVIPTEPADAAPTPTLVSPSLPTPTPTPSARPRRPSAPPAKPAPPPAPAPRPVVTTYEAESPANGLSGTRIFRCNGCSGERKVGNIGAGMGALQFNGVTAATTGDAVVTLTYVNGEGARDAQLSVNGGAAVWLTFPGTGGWSTVGTLTVTVKLRGGANTLKLFNVEGPAPDFDTITVRAPAR